MKEKEEGKFDSCAVLRKKEDWQKLPNSSWVVSQPTPEAQPLLDPLMTVGHAHATTLGHVLCHKRGDGLRSKFTESHVTLAKWTHRSAGWGSFTQWRISEKPSLARRACIRVTPKLAGSRFSRIALHEKEVSCAKVCASNSAFWNSPFLALVFRFPRAGAVSRNWLNGGLVFFSFLLFICLLARLPAACFFPLHFFRPWSSYEGTT